MTNIEAAQSVQDLDPSLHARVLGAPGTGKSVALVEAFARVSQLPGWREGDVLVLVPGRLAAASLRSSIERRLDTAFAGTPVRTPASLAFSVLQREAAIRGDDAPRLLTGSAHDEVIAGVLNGEPGDGDRAGAYPGPFAPEVLAGAAFRAELRDFARVLDDYALSPEGLLRAIVSPTQQSRAGELMPGPELSEQWAFAVRMLVEVERALAEQHPGELTASGMQRLACEIIEGGAAASLPRLVLVDDAQDLGEGALALIAALASRGASVWAFGDPDIATAAFQGEHTRVLGGLVSELARRGVRGPGVLGEEQVVVLGSVYRHGAELRELVSSVTSRIGTGGAGQQRAALAADPSRTSRVQFALAATTSEQLGIIAHRLRRRRLGLGGAAVPWSEMAVICRSRDEAKRAARVLASHQVPTSVRAGGVVPGEHRLVRDLIRVLQYALGLAPLTIADLHDALGGAIGGLDPIALRRLRGSVRLNEQRAAREEGREPLTVDSLLLAGFESPGDEPIVDSRGGRRLHRLGRIALAAVATHGAGGTPREVLWQLWSGTGLASSLQDEALTARGARSDEAHRALDAVLGLFFALQRHEEQDSERAIGDVLDELLTSTVPEDTLAARSERDVVTVSTPQGIAGRQFAVVCMLGPQDGAWPNLRSRGSLLGTTALERWLRGMPAEAPSRRDTMHDELRLFAHTVSRASDELLAVAVRNEDAHPSVFFSLAEQHLVAEALPSSRLTLRGAVAEMRRRVTRDPADAEALDTLAALAGAGVSGAHPDEWYGVLPLSTDAPLVDLDADPDASVSVSPSQLENAERCPLDWVISRLGGSKRDANADIGTLMHHALETAETGASATQLLETVLAEWSSLRFEAEWQEERARADVAEMAAGVANYLERFEADGGELVATEAGFTVPIGRVRLRGYADRLEGSTNDEGVLEITVVDLKTGRTKPTAAELLQHAQLQAYQLGVIRGAFSNADGTLVPEARNGGAKLVYVHPRSLTQTQQKNGERFVEVRQAGLSEADQQALERRVTEIAAVMAAARFEARVEHHCENPHAKGGACRLHIIPAVSHA